MSELEGCSAAEPYALRVMGDSMMPEFEEGHIIIVDPVMPATCGAYVVIDYNGETTFRQFVVEGDRYFLKALDTRIPPVELIGEYRVRGVVVQRNGQGRRNIKHYA